MNDFNKGELQIILLEMNISIQRTPKQLKVSPIYIALRDKVESIIDNYCEHQWRKGVHLFNDIYCNKCHKHFPMNNEKE